MSYETAKKKPKSGLSLKFEPKTFADFFKEWLEA
jgi:hypothetical protein